MSIFIMKEHFDSKVNNYDLFHEKRFQKEHDRYSVYYSVEAVVDAATPGAKIVSVDDELIIHEDLLISKVNELILAGTYTTV